MNKKIYIGFLVVVFVIVIVYLQQNGDLFKSQVLVDTVEAPKLEEVTDYEDCYKFSEFKANECFLKLALKEKDEDLCDKISKSSEIRTCKRKVQLSQ